MTKRISILGTWRPVQSPGRGGCLPQQAMLTFSEDLMEGSTADGPGKQQISWRSTNETGTRASEQALLRSPLPDASVAAALVRFVMK